MSKAERLEPSEVDPMSTSRERRRRVPSVRRAMRHAVGRGLLLGLLLGAALFGALVLFAHYTDATVPRW